MKGISHFVTGVALASFFPEAVRAAEAGNPVHFVLGGVCGLLPDTLDFKFWRYCYRHDMEVIPDPLRPDPGMVAGAVAAAVNKAHAEGRPVRIKLNTVKLGPDAWQQYVIRFRPAERRIEVAFGPVVDTGQQPLRAPPRVKPASAQVAADMRVDYELDTNVDIFDGPTFEMRPCAEGRVEAVFLPWHRQWTHSLVVGVMVGVAAGLVWGVTAGMVAALAWAAHVLEDQLGYMGSALWFPFATRRSRGAGLMHAVEPLPNLAVVWAACVLMFWNLWRYGAEAKSAPGLVPWILAASVPLVVAVWWRRFRARQGPTLADEYGAEGQ
jgi:membrane-bound metal-dependent hydrolase YbcI (DUF457 family)